jgi:GNAT superfamily N-acetyltransferase
VTALANSPTPAALDEVVTRVAIATDVPAMLALHQRCSADSLRFRYLSAYVPDEATLLAMISRTHTLLAWHDGHVVGMGNLAFDNDRAELALLVEDAWQGRGIGWLLGTELAALARERGATALNATTAGANRRVHELMGRIAGVPMTVEYAEGTAYVSCPLTTPSTVL